MAKRYLKTGGINPEYLAEQDAQNKEDLINEMIGLHANFIQLKKYNPEEVKLIEKAKLEARLEFMQEHSNNKIEYDMAKLIIIGRRN